MKKRPTIVNTITALQLFGGLYLLVDGLGTLFFKWHSELIPHQVKFVIFVGFILLFFSLVNLLLAYGLFTLKSLAWTTTLIFEGWGILGELYKIYNHQ